MNKDLEANIFNSYPELFKHRDDMKQSLMCFGIEPDNGWYNLINDLCADIYHYYNTKYDGVDYDGNKYHHEVPPSFYVTQIKEKFGSLRFYIMAAPEDIHDMVHKAENKSYYICEVCGKEGKQFYRDDLPWVRTLCDECLDAHISDRYKRVRKAKEDFISNWQKKHKAPFVEG